MYYFIYYLCLWHTIVSMKKHLTHYIPFMASSVKAGFPNPAEDARSTALDLNELVVRHPVSTYYIRVEGDSMQDAGIASGDILVVDKALAPKNGDIVVAAIDGEFTVKYLKHTAQGVWLVAANEQYAPITVQDSADFSIWGVVTYIVHKAQRGRV